MRLPRSRCQIEISSDQNQLDHTPKSFWKQNYVVWFAARTHFRLDNGLIWVCLGTILACHVELEVKLLRVKSLEKPKWTESRVTLFWVFWAYRYISIWWEIFARALLALSYSHQSFGLASFEFTPQKIPPRPLFLSQWREQTFLNYIRIVFGETMLQRDNPLSKIAIRS